MSTIFISHSSKDNEAAKALNVLLEREGHTCVFLDLDPEKGIIAGKSWERTLYRKLRACRAVIALCTDDYLSSHWCFAEIALARMEAKPIFALLLDPLQANPKLPSILTEKQYIDLRPNPEEAYRRLWRGLNELELLGVVGGWDPKESPYLGLGAYQEKHAPVFFGRSDESRAGVELLDRGSPGLIMTLGASGSGKSSLVRAGIIPRLRRDPDRWIIVEPFRPQTNPFLELADALVRTYRRYAPDSTNRIGDVDLLCERLRVGFSGADESDDNGSSTLTQDERVQRLLVQLEDLHETPPDSAVGSFLNFLDWSVEDLRKICDPLSTINDSIASNGRTILTDIASDLLKLCERRNARVLIVVDQFEELLGTDMSCQYGDEFMALLRNSVESEGGPVMILATMRTDFLTAFQKDPVMSGVDFKSLSLGPVRADSLRKIIESPAKLGAIELGDGLTDRLLMDTQNSNALPLLSFTLWVLWRDFHDDGVLTLPDYEKLGGLQGAIGREADALLEKQDDIALRDAFLEMVRISEEGTYARKVANWDNERLLPVHSLLERFIDRRLLVSRTEGDSRLIEVAHEALFYSWPPLKAWLDEHRTEMLLSQQIAREAATWESNNRSSDILWRGGRLQQAKGLLEGKKLQGTDKEFIHKGLRRQSLMRATFSGIAISVFAGMAALTTWALQQRTEALRQEDIAIGLMDTAIKQEGIALKAKDDLNRQYAELVWELVNPPFLEAQTPGAQVGEVNVIASDYSTFEAEVFGADASDQTQTAATSNPTLIGRVVGGGNTIAIAHDGLISQDNESKLFLKNALSWLADNKEGESEPITIAFTTGHCEVVSDSKYPTRPDFNLPLENISSWGYKIEPVNDLTSPGALTDTQVLIVGNAWASFTTEEIDAVETFSKSGGAMLLAGLGGSWSFYSTRPNEYNPCDWATDSDNRSVATQRYPMNELGQRLGLEWSLEW